MKKFVFYLSMMMMVFVLVAKNASAKPYSRVKRVSDQRLAELETLVGLSKMTGKLVTVPLGFGQVDPNRIGRRRRSQQQALIFDRLFNLAEEDNGDPEPPERRIYEDAFFNNR